MAEFKPCPFCGSDRITVWNIRDGQQAVCKDCKSTGAPVFHGKDGFESTWHNAIDAWNRRKPLTVSKPDQMMLGVARLANIEGNQIVIRVSLDALPNATALALEKELGEHRYRVVDNAAWAKSIVKVLQSEKENGDTLIDEMLDSALYQAFDSGDEGVEEAAIAAAEQSTPDKGEGEKL